jgi:hypothetical protein
MFDQQGDAQTWFGDFFDIGQHILRVIIVPKDD